MNFEIKEKNNSIVKIINNEQIINSEQIINKEQINDADCSCLISSGYESCTSSNTSSKSSKLLKNKIMTKHLSNKNEEMSLLEDDYFIQKTKIQQNNTKLTNEITNEITTKSINSEFQNIFIENDQTNKFDKFIELNKTTKIKNKLENIYNKLIKNPTENKLIQNDLYKISNYIGQNEMFNKIKNNKMTDDEIGKISNLIEYIFNESTRGWNYDNNVYILQIDKLKENFEKVIYTNDVLNSIKMGFIYRDFNDPKVYVDKDFTKYWIGFDINTDKLYEQKCVMIATKYNIKNKILFYCLKNLAKSNKFKKKISKWNYKFIKKTVQIYQNKNLIIDIILFVGINNNLIYQNKNLF